MGEYMEKRYTMPVAVYGILLNDKNEILLMRRANTGFADGLWSLPSGHVEANEGLKTAIIRELKEEINVDVVNKNVEFKHVIHRRSDCYTYIDFFFNCKSWEGIIVNNEPNKCSEIKWFNLENLPSDIIPYVKNIIIEKEQKNNFSIIGLEEEE